MPEFRQNLATKEWIIIAAERAKRPEDFACSRAPSAALPAHDPTCPFCPGQEAKTPDAVLVLPPGAQGDSWQVRVVPNKFPALVPGHDENCMTCSERMGPYLRRAGVGHHEVIIEAPQHHRDLPLLSAPHMACIVEAYRQRYLALSRYASTELVVLFRNHGQQAGTSLVHPHSQVVASSVVPFRVRNRIYEGQRHFDMHGRCVYCDMIAYELCEGTRVIIDNDHFVAFTPYASSVPYHIWLLPKHHRATFGSIRPEEVPDMALVLQNLLARLWRLLGDPDYNFVIETIPMHMAEVPFYHWHLEIFPKLTTPAGFEIGSGISINVVSPEQAAQDLRNTDGARIMTTA